MEQLVLAAFLGPLLGKQVRMELQKGGIAVGSLLSCTTRKTAGGSVRVCFEVDTGQGGRSSSDFDTADISEVSRTADEVWIRTQFFSVTIRNTKKQQQQIW